MSTISLCGPEKNYKMLLLNQRMGALRVEENKKHTSIFYGLSVHFDHGNHGEEASSFPGECKQTCEYLFLASDGK